MKSLLAIAILFVASVGLSQEIKDDAIPRLDGGDVMRPCFLIVCDSAPNRILILDDAGKWMHRVKETEIKIDSNQSSTVKCLMYEGAFRPSRPESKTWRLSQVRTVSDAEFQALVDNLQTDPEAVKKMFAKPAQAAQPAAASPVAVQPAAEKK